MKILELDTERNFNKNGINRTWFQVDDEIYALTTDNTLLDSEGYPVPMSMRHTRIMTALEPYQTHVTAELDRGVLSAECPSCGCLDGYVSTGEHTPHGTDIIRCGVCGYKFKIGW